MKRKIILSAIFTSGFFLVSCGGGNSSTSDTGGTINTSFYADIEGQVTDGIEPSGIIPQDYQIGKYTLKYISAVTVYDGKLIAISSNIDNDGKFHLRLLKDKDYTFTIFDNNENPVVSSIGKVFEIKDNDFVNIELMDSDNDGEFDDINIKPSNKQSVIQKENPQLIDDDGDKIPDIIKDIDSDNDKNPDIHVFWKDRDNDGTIDSAEDRDNDGTPDIIQDHNGNHLPDIVENPKDSSLEDFMDKVFNNKENKKERHQSENENGSGNDNNKNQRDHSFENVEDNDHKIGHKVQIVTLGGSVVNETISQTSADYAKYVVAYTVNNENVLPVMSKIDQYRRFKLKVAKDMYYVFSVFDENGNLIAITDNEAYKVLGNNSLTLKINDQDNDGEKEIQIDISNPKNLKIDAINSIGKDYSKYKKKPILAIIEPIIKNGDINKNGIPDLYEAFSDIDGDGIYDSMQDKDKNSIPDIIEDKNSNGIPDGFDDMNNDGIKDFINHGKMLDDKKNNSYSNSKDENNNQGNMNEEDTNHQSGLDENKGKNYRKVNDNMENPNQDSSDNNYKNSEEYMNGNNYNEDRKNDNTKNQNKNNNGNSYQNNEDDMNNYNHLGNNNKDIKRNQNNDNTGKNNSGKNNLEKNSDNRYQERTKR